ncbi:MAG: hypothetical protein GAK39_03477 [Variovorax sp.]|nr:MAG: hypothetical protein GAK39_03477 [Variovorax sp.]
MSLPLRRLQHAPANTNPIVHPQPIRHQHPGTQPRNPPFNISQPSSLCIQPEFLALRLLSIPTNEFLRPRSQRLRRLLPDHQLQRIPPPISPHPVILPSPQRPHNRRNSRRPRQRLTGRQGRRMHLRRRINKHPRSRPPHRPHPKSAQRKPRLRRQRRHRMQPPSLRQKSDLHRRAALRRHIGPRPLPAAANRHPDPVAHPAPRVVQHHPEHRRAPRVMRIGRHQVHRQPAQGAVAYVHAHRHAAREQEGQQVAEVELVIDRRHQ